MNSLILTLEEKIARTEHTICNLTQDIAAAQYESQFDESDASFEVIQSLSDYRRNAKADLIHLQGQL